MIFPTSFLGENDSKVLRQEFFENCKINKILEFPESTEVFGKENTQDVTILCYKKERAEDYTIPIRMNVDKEEVRKLSKLDFLLLKKSEIRDISMDYQIPIFQDAKKEWDILRKISKIPPFKGNGKIPPVGEVGEGHLHETFDKEFLSEKPTGDLVIKGIHLDRYYVNLDPNGPQPRWVKKGGFLRKKPEVADFLIRNPKIVGLEVQNKALLQRLNFIVIENDYILTNTVRYILIAEQILNPNFLLGILNSRLLNWRFKLFSQTNHIKKYEIESLPIVRATPDQQAPIISLVDAIIQKKKEYHAISQNIENYIDFEKVDLVRLDEFLKGVLDDFEIVSSLKVKHDNFNALRLRIEGDKAILEYGMRKRVENYEEIEEDEQIEVRGRYVVEWHTAGEGRIKDRLAVEFLAKIIEKERRFSRARSKTMWQKIAEVKVPEFTSEVRKGFSEYKSAMKKAKELDEEITRIDRAIDRLVYDLYGLTEDEVKVVERSVWSDKFDEMYGKLSSRDSALRLAEEVKR